jgi:hypothetical protein
LSSKAPDLNFFVDDHDTLNGQTLKTYISAFKQNSASSLSGYFRDSLMHYLAANYILYRPTLVETDLWKWDVSGETDYGLVTPPTDTEYEFFDRNFALQFVVHGKGLRSCKDLGLECANPAALRDGLVLSGDGCTASPYCNCPAKYLMPTEDEPTYLEIEKLRLELNECKLIYDNLGKDWLGCEFSDPTSTCSCNCPEQGNRFKDYLNYTRTYATFWECPLDLPLRRRAQSSQMQAQIVKIKIYPNNKVRVGSLIEIYDPNDLQQLTKNKYKKISGKWMIAEIQQVLSSNTHIMELTLIRNSLHYDPNESQKPEAIFKDTEIIG